MSLDCGGMLFPWVKENKLTPEGEKKMHDTDTISFATDVA